MPRFLLILTLVAASTNLVRGEKAKPFPQNRVRDFYANQARRFLASNKPIPDLLPEFPGLDGGSFGHWGQNPEADNFDYSLNDVDVGGVIAQVINHFGKTTTKAVCVRIGDAGGFTALFDPERLTYTDVWRGDLVRWQASRFGITSGVVPAGEQHLNLQQSRWTLPQNTQVRYRGFYRNGARIVFRYDIGNASLYDHIWEVNGKIIQSITVEGDLPAGTELTSSLAPDFDAGETKQLAAAGEGKWTQLVVETVGKLGSSDGPYIIDALTIPYGSTNPFGTPMRVGGFDFLPDGRAAVATLIGDVWLVDGIDDGLSQLKWQRIAAGLHQPLGLVVQDGQILVLGRDQLTRLHDLNGDDEADYYECVTNEFPTEGGGNFATTLHQDHDNRLYWFTASKGFGMTRLTEGRKPQSIATGVRNSNGTGVSPDGTLVLATAQEGTWTPATAIFAVGGGSYHGLFGPREEYGRYGYQMPLCFIPRGIDNSSGDLAFLPNDERMGPLAGKIIGTSFGYCQHYLVLHEEIGSIVQGGVVPLPGDFLSGAHRSRFNSRDGCFYVAGTDGWQSYARENGSLERVRCVGGRLHLPAAVETHENGLVVRFNCRIDRDSVRVENVFCEQWNYLYSQAYGSAEYSVRQAGRRGHDRVEVRSVNLLDDGQSLFVEIPQLHPVMQFHCFMQLKTKDGESFDPDFYYSIFQQREPFTSFAGYTAVPTKKHYAAFPMAKTYPRDPRLAAQEDLGKTLVEMVSRELKAIPGLQYEPRRLRVPPGRRVALTFRNTDPSMPHNVVIVRPDRLQAIGTASMLLAADPRAIATHYVPNDPGVLCLSPILNPDDQYSIYFDSPQEKGAYPFVCTFPGHWKVMRGVLYVLDEGEEMPPESELARPARRFVRMWKTEDLAADAVNVSTHSASQGREVFHAAGCIQCHVMNGQGAKLGPDLTNINERFKGTKLLQQILEPSSEINQDYRTYLASTQDGQTVTGLKIKEDDESIHLLTNPLKPSEVAIVRKVDLDVMTASPQSTMPKGLLMTFDKHEILDLLAFLQSNGELRPAP